MNQPAQELHLDPASTAAAMFPPLAVQRGGRCSTAACAAGKDLVLSPLEAS